MELKEKLLRIGFVSLIGVILVLIIAAGITRRSHQREITDLQNRLATSSQTIETQKGMYEKLSLQANDLTTLIDTKDKQLAELKDKVKRGKEDVLAMNTLVLSWKHAYEATLIGTQTDVPPVDATDPNAVTRKKVEFEKDWGFIALKGYTLTDPPEAGVKVWQPRPLRLSVVVSQLPDGTWKSRVTSSEDNFAIDIGLAAVNPRMLEPKWYENIGLSLDLGYATGFVGGVGASYKIGRFDVGPKFWFSVTNRVDMYAGLGVTWHPFAR